MKFKNNQAQLFAAPKVHSKARSLRIAIEMVLLTLLSLGTFFTIASPTHLSFDQLLKNTKELLGLKGNALEKSSLSFEERIRFTFDKKILNITSLKVSKDGFATVQSAEGTTLIVSEEKSLAEQARALQTLLSKAKIEGRLVSLVDFRFDKLVVRYK